MRRPAQTAPFVSARIALGPACRCTRSADAPAAHFNPNPNPLARLFLAPYDLTPTYKTVHNKFSVKYYLNLVLVDEEDRRYFKQQEIALFRLREPPPGPPTPAGMPPAVAPAPARLGTPPSSP
jgi:hypothetical protein